MDVGTDLEASAKTQRITLPIYDLVCGGGLIVERVLTRTPGVVRVYVNPVIEMAYIEYDPKRTNPDQLVAVVERAGFKAGPPSVR